MKLDNSIRVYADDKKLQHKIDKYAINDTEFIYIRKWCPVNNELMSFLANFGTDEQEIELAINEVKLIYATFAKINKRTWKDNSYIYKDIRSELYKDKRALHKLFKFKQKYPDEILVCFVNNN